MSNAVSYSTGGGGGSGVLSLKGNDGVLVTPNGSGTINLLGDGTLLHVTGTTYTETITMSNGTDGQLLIGNSLGGTPAWASVTAGSGITLTVGHNSLQIAATGATASVSFTTDDANTITNSAFTLTGSSGITTASSGSTLTIALTSPVSTSHGGTGAAGTLTGVISGHGASAMTASSVTNHYVLVGGSSQAITSVSPSTSGFVLTSQGTSSDPVFAAPAASSITLTGDTGGALTGSGFTLTGGLTGLVFNGSGTTETLAGILVPANGGLGVAGVTGVMIGHGSSAVTGQAINQHSVLVGGSGNAITSVAPSSTSGWPLVSAGSSSDPSFAVLGVVGGGTGSASYTPYSVILAGNTSTSPLTNVSGLGSAGQVLESQGAGLPPVWTSASSGTTTFNADSGSATVSGSTITMAGGTNMNTSATGSTVTYNLNNSVTLSGYLTAAGNITTTAGNLIVTAGNLQLPLTNSAGTQGVITVGGSQFWNTYSNGGSTNLFLGGSGNINASNSGSSNYALGAGALASLTSGNYNVALGQNTGTSLTSGGVNTIIGQNAGITCTTSVQNVLVGANAGTGITTGSNNTCVGYFSGYHLGSGGSNVLVGANAGANLTGSDSYNVMLNHEGSAGENNYFVVGSGTGTGAAQINNVYIYGINGRTVTGGVSVITAASGKLGTSTSSLRFKKNVEDMGSSSAALYDLRPVTFNYKESSEFDVTVEDSNMLQYGLIAEEVEGIMPDLVAYDDQNRPENVRYLYLIPMLLNEIQKLEKRVAELESK